MLHKKGAWKEGYEPQRNLPIKENKHQTKIPQ